MGNQMGAKLTTLREEINKKMDETRTRFDDVTYRYRENVGINVPATEGSQKKIPKISITGRESHMDLLDENIIDKSLRGDIEIANHTTFDDITTIPEEGDENENEPNNKVVVATEPTTTTTNNECRDFSANKKTKKSRNSITEMSRRLDNLARTNKEAFASLVRGDDKEAKIKKKEILCIDDVCFTVDKEAVPIAKYCIPLLQVVFCGQTTCEGSSDKSDTKDVLNLGLYLKLVDKFLRQFESVTDFSGDEEEYLRLLKLVSLKRKHKLETTKQCYTRIILDSQRFVKIYHERGIQSERLQHKNYWGSKQQMLAGKVIADWVDPDGGPIDPIFGAILQPTAGRCGPGDSGWIHNILFDDCGYMAYHSATHDAFGYLINYHNIGPGYDYMERSRLETQNPLSGQLSGVRFWKEVIADLDRREKEITYLEM